MFKMWILIFFLLLHFPGYAGEDKDKAHEEKDEQGDKAAFV